MIYEFAHVAVYARDVNRSLDFYTRVLGAKCVREAFIPATRTKCMYLQISESILELLWREQTTAQDRIGFDHLAFMVRNLDATYGDLAAAGLNFTVLPKIAGSGNGRVAFLLDPDGTRVELIERKDNYRIARIEEGTVKRFAHVAVSVRDLASAEEFYTKYMQLEFARRATLDSREVVYLTKGVDTLELTNKATTEHAKYGIDHITLSVEDPEGAVSKFGRSAVECGTESRREPDGAQVHVIRDPDGTRIELIST